MQLAGKRTHFVEGPPKLARAGSDLILNLDASVQGLWRASRRVVTGPRFEPRAQAPRQPLIEQAGGFRRRMLSLLRRVSAERRPLSISRRAVRRFLNLTRMLQRDGVVAFEGMVPQDQFCELVSRYDELVASGGTTQLLHTFLDLETNCTGLSKLPGADAFRHPLLIMLVEYALGAPAQLVDVRGKDTQEMSAHAKENIPHLDNSPFVDEFKILLTWSSHTVNGPTGQPFVVIPPPHSVNRVLKDQSGNPFSTENAGLFSSRVSVEDLLDIASMANEGYPRVIYFVNPQIPLTTVFAASSVPHHRHRTINGGSRSSIALAFHRAACPDAEAHGTSLQLAELVKVVDLLSQPALPHVPNHRFQLSKLAVDRWRDELAAAPDIKLLKAQNEVVPVGSVMSRARFVEWLGETAMAYDLAETVDLALHPDGHEEVRKSARKQIRESDARYRVQRLLDWLAEFEQPTLHHIMTPTRLSAWTRSVATEIRASRKSLAISKSLAQLAEDCSEALTRSFSMANNSATALLAFWACDSAIAADLGDNSKLRRAGGHLLRHYIATILAAEQLRPAGT